MSSQECNKKQKKLLCMKRYEIALLVLKKE